MDTAFTQPPDSESGPDRTDLGTGGQDETTAQAARTRQLETELGKARAELYEALARLKFLEQTNPQAAFLNNVSEGVIFVNAGDEVTYANPHFLDMIGAGSAERVLYKALPSALWDTPRELERLLSDLHAGRYIRERECTLRNFRGEPLVVLCNATPVQDRAGAYLGGAIVLRDITAKRALEMELRRQNEAYLKLVDKLQLSLSALRNTQSRLLAEANLSFASHLSANLLPELSDAVSLIEVRSYLLEHTLKSDETLLANVRQIHDAVERIAAVADSLRNLPRFRESPDQFDLRDVLSEVLSDGKEGLHLDDCEVAVECPESPALTEGHRAQVQQAVTNILVNAGEAMARLPSDAPKRLDVRLSVNGKYAAINVCDSGPGFDRQVITRLFRPGNTTKAVSGRATGLGLGLFVAHQVAEAHGGSLDVQSEPGAGATVTLRLPLLPPPRQR